MSGKLYVVGTPIGNLGDFSPRAAATLEQVDFIAAEDTRVTRRLLEHFKIKREIISYYEHNRTERGGEIIGRLLQGETCALVSDAGMPAISDPGEDLVRQAHESGIAVESVPGPSALTTALSVAGMPSGRFCFEGFLSVNKSARREHLDSLRGETRTMVFYEAPHKLIAALNDMLAAFGDRELALVRELTKIHETVLCTYLSEALRYYTENAPKGEYVLIIAGCREEQRESFTLRQATDLAKELAQQGMQASAAAREAAETTGIKKGDIYRELVRDTR